MASSSRVSKRKQSSPIPLLWSPDLEKRYREVKELECVGGRFVDFKKFDCHGFKALCDRVEWTNFLSLNVPFYPSLMHEFYANLRHTKEKKLETMVRGVKIDLDKQLLHNVAGIPKTGIHIYKKSFEEVFPEGDSKILFVPNAVTQHLTSELKWIPKMTHHVIVHNINTKLGNVDRVNLTNQILIYSLVSHTKVNLASFILHKMVKTKGHLPYGMIITQILDAHGIDFTGVPTGKPKNPFNAKSIQQMGIIRHVPDPTPVIIPPAQPTQTPQLQGPSTSSSSQVPPEFVQQLHQLHENQRVILERLDEHKSILQKILDFISCNR